MIYTIIIPHKLPSLNDYVRACRSCAFAGASMKKKTEHLIMPCLTDLPTLDKPVTISCHWIDANSRRDIDNVAFGIKFVLDALQAAGKLPNDNREHVRGISHSFDVDTDTKSYSVTVKIEEMMS